jgi:hypothetical protein
MKLQLTVVSLEGGVALLKLSDGGTVAWPLGSLPAELKIGATLSFIISESGAGVGDPELAKTLLNEIINADE